MNEVFSPDGISMTNCVEVRGLSHALQFPPEPGQNLKIERRLVDEVTKTIPIVFNLGADPVASGLVTSFARPGGNVTGFAIGLYEASSWLSSRRRCPGSPAWRFQLLRGTYPR